MRDIFLTLVFLSFFVMGVAAPFALMLGYLWVDTFRPQEVTYSILNAAPVSMLLAAGAIGLYVLLDRRSPPRVNATMVMTILMAGWITLTTVYAAVVPEAAWQKWDWAFKTLLFSVFVQFMIRSRIQIEAFLQVYVFALAANFVAAAGKTILSGGGYGQTLGLSVETNITESSIFSGICLMMIPIILFLRQHSLIFPKSRATDLMYAGLATAALIATIGTYARTAVVGMLVLAIAFWIQTKRKFLFGVGACAAVLAIALFTSEGWNQRISTIDDYQTESSALSRILVWQWTLEFVRDNPHGGGFESWRTNHIVLPGTEHTEPRVINGKAFHSIYFEMLGEHGWIGLLIFSALVATCFLNQLAVIRQTRAHSELAWCSGLARTLLIAMLTILACGSFVSIGFLPMIWYLFALTAALRHHVRVVLLNSAAAGERRLRASFPESRVPLPVGGGTARRSAQ